CSPGYKPGNAADGEGGQPMSLYPATAASVNTYFTHLMLMVGPKAGLDVARRMGISNAPAPGQPGYSDWAVCSLVLGSKEVAPLDMASAFGVLANNGVRCQPFCIQQVVNSDGR